MFRGSRDWSPRRFIPTTNKSSRKGAIFKAKDHSSRLSWEKSK